MYLFKNKTWIQIPVTILMMTNSTVEGVANPESRTPSKSIIDLDSTALDNIEDIKANINRYDSYRENCHKYYSAPIRKLKNIFDETNDDFDLSVSYWYFL